MARTKTRLTGEQQGYLERLAEAARRRDDAEAAYKEAFLAAYEQGLVTQTAIAETLGIKSESVRRYLQRHSECPAEPRQQRPLRVANGNELFTVSDAIKSRAGKMRITLPDDEAGSGLADGSTTDGD